MTNFLLKKIKKEAKELQQENKFIKYAHVLDFTASRSGFNSYNEVKEKLSSSNDDQEKIMEEVINKRKEILDSIEIPEKKEKEKEFIEKLEKSTL